MKRINGKPTRTYRKWSSMIQRCTNPHHDAYPWYGGRGVKVCKRWRLSFDAFLEDMGDAPPGLWLDRKDGSKDYEPGNCQWVTPKASAMNRRQRGEMPGSLKDKARKAGLPYSVVYQRIRSGTWTEAMALSTPIQDKHTRNVSAMRRARIDAVRQATS